MPAAVIELRIVRITDITHVTRFGPVAGVGRICIPCIAIIGGIELTDEQMKALKEMDKEQLKESLTDLDNRLTMNCWMRVSDPIFDPW